MIENIEKNITTKTSTHLPVMESFYTIQGEGFYQGHAAYFIRLGGCDVGCVWCDVKESWDIDAHPKFSIDKIVAKALDEVGGNPKNIIAVITGGEPLMHQLDALTDALHQAGFQTNIETSGAHPLSGHFDWICLSPKKFKFALPDVIEAANELKVIIFNKSDFAWAEKYAAEVNPACKLYIQPEWSKRAEMLPLMIDYVKNNPQWEICLQIHKYMDIP